VTPDLARVVHMLYTDADAQCDKLACDRRKYCLLCSTDDARQFVILSVHLCRAKLAIPIRLSTFRGEVQTLDRVPEETSLILENIRFS